ncbi:hypothetical protein CABS01_04651 [Colletotrichum abscissum]|uniref:uncharacterized protein n=1 Tax=Colletotrichum abscissum TaxID=1671311 RepID=UPI0027D49788|nr:uncharacterized protein CABS01_04651 [Colletotrichum abscissum]KAK1472008.1 hypothetical protein CABS01_04651 [Colletotrichum abscissum]
MASSHERGRNLVVRVRARVRCMCYSRDLARTKRGTKDGKLPAHWLDTHNIDGGMEGQREEEMSARHVKDVGQAGRGAQRKATTFLCSIPAGSCCILPGHRGMPRSLILRIISKDDNSYVSIYSKKAAEEEEREENRARIETGRNRQVEAYIIVRHCASQHGIPSKNVRKCKTRTGARQAEILYRNKANEALPCLLLSPAHRQTVCFMALTCGRSASVA